MSNRCSICGPHQTNLLMCAACRSASDRYLARLANLRKEMGQRATWDMTDLSVWSAARARRCERRRHKARLERLEHHLLRLAGHDRRRRSR